MSRRPAHLGKRNHRYVDHSGKRFGMLVALHECPTHVERPYWVCQCDCGQQTTVRASRLTSGVTKSCGCLVGGKPRHGRSTNGDITYATWSSMTWRCGTLRGYKSVSVCERWKVFENFLEDMGERPSARHSIDRIDNSKGYEPGNCRWATAKQQNRNKTNNHVLTYNGRTMPITAWAEELGVSHTALYRRVKSGWTPRDTIEVPVAERKMTRLPSAASYVKRADKAGLPGLTVARVYKLRHNEQRNRQRCPEGEPVDFVGILIRQKLKCAICEERMDWNASGREPDGISLDHEVALACGGKHVSTNVRGTHRRCNLGKGSSTDTPMAAKIKRLQLKTGQQARRKRNGSQIQSRGFSQHPTLKRTVSGKVVQR